MRGENDLHHSIETARDPLVTSEVTQKLMLRKNVTVQKCKFSGEGPDSQMGGRGPQWTGALYRDPKEAQCSERMMAIPAAVAEKIEF